MVRLTAPQQSVFNSSFYWLRVTSFIAGATMQIDGQFISIDANLAYQCRKRHPWRQLIIGGTATVEISTDPCEPFPGAAPQLFNTNSSFGFVTRYEVDFTAQPSQDFKAGGDKDYIIDGKTWHVSGTANGSITRLAFGTGIDIKASAGSGPNLYTAFSLLGYTPGAGDEIECWYRFQSAGVLHNSAWTPMGMADCAVGGAGINRYNVLSGVRNSTDHAPNAHWLTYSQFNGVPPALGSLPGTFTNLGHDVLVIRRYNTVHFQCWSGVWNNGWPAYNTLQQRGMVQMYNIPVSTNMDVEVSNNGVIFNAQVNSSADTPELIVKNFRFLSR